MRRQKNKVSYILSLVLLLLSSLTYGQDYFEAMGVKKLWDAGYRGEGIVVMDIGPGVYLDHQGLSSSWRGQSAPTGWDWYDPLYGTSEPSVNAAVIHGTATLSCIVGNINGEYYGTAPEATWIAARISDDPHDEIRTQSIIDCLDWVISMPNQYLPDVINCSFHDFNEEYCSEFIKDQLITIENRGVAIVFAAGNSGLGKFNAPQGFVHSETIPFLVGGLNWDLETITTSTSRGEAPCYTGEGDLGYKPEIYAPSFNISVFDNSINGVGVGTGTSFAAPLVAGGVALLKQINPSLTGKQILQLLMDSAIDPNSNGNDPEWGWGIVNFENAVHEMQKTFADFQNTIISTGNNIDDSRLVVVDNIGTAYFDSPTTKLYELPKTISVSPEEEYYSETRFYNWNNNSRDINRTNIQLVGEAENIFRTNFAIYKPLTVRNLLEGVLSEGTIWFGERSLDERNVISGHTEDAFIYNPTGGVLTQYKSEASDVIADVAGTNWKFLSWENGSTNRIRDNIQVSEQTPSIMSAIYKGSLRSSSTSALRGPSQRKIARTSDGTFHIVYESMGKVWYEYSTDGGGSWNLVDLQNDESKLPSIDFYGNQVGIAYQQKNGSNTDFRIHIFNSGSDVNLYSGAGITETGYGNYKPVVAMSGNGRVFLAYITPNSTIKSCLLYINPDGIPYYSDILTQANGVTNISVASDKSQDDLYHLVWQESEYRIEYIKADYLGSGFQGHTIVSNNSGYERHKNPEVTLVNGLPIVGWVGERTEGGIIPPPPIWKTNAFGGGGSTLQTSRRGILRKQNSNSSWSSTFYKYGSDVIDVALNTAGSSYVFTFYSNATDDFGQTSRQTKAVKGGSTLLYNLASNGSEYYFSNGTNYNNMYGVDVNLGTDFNPASAPFSLRANSLFTVNKISAADSVLIGREGVTTRDSVQFYFTFGEIIVDGVQVNFVELPDTMKEIKNSNQLNKFLVSEPFTLDDNSQFTYGVMCGVADSADVEVALEKNKYINFKVELIEDKSQKVLGVYDNVTFTSDSINYYSNKNYQVDTKGIGNKTVRLRLQVKDNFKQNYSIGNLLVEDSLMYKKGYNELNYKGELLVKDYDLVQNYPNPFNPTTTIKYQIPKSGHVKLRVYDILGREVTTLINEYLEDGRYEAVFNANELSSGVYIYRLEVNDFITSKKMMLVK